MHTYIVLPSDKLIPSDQQQATVPSDEHSTQKDQASVLRGKRAVIVEDEGVTQMLLRRMLKVAGLTVVASAINGEAGVEVVLRERPDLVLMDIRMPGLFNGIEAARRILAEYHVCIVMLTAFSDEEYRKQAEALKTCGYVVKPVTSEILMPQLEAAFRNFGLH